MWDTKSSGDKARLEEIDEEEHVVEPIQLNFVNIRRTRNCSIHFYHRRNLRFSSQSRGSQR